MQLVIEALINVLHRCVTQIFIYIFIKRQIEEIQKYLCGANKFSQQDPGVSLLSLLPCYDVSLIYLSPFSVYSLIPLKHNGIIDNYCLSATSHYFPRKGDSHGEAR